MPERQSSRQQFIENASFLLFPAMLGDRTLFLVLALGLLLLGIIEQKSVPNKRFLGLGLFLILCILLSFWTCGTVPIALFERKLNVLWIPILIWAIGPIAKNKKLFNGIEIGCAIFSTILLINVGLNFLFLHNKEFMYYHGFSDNFKFNAIYLSAYLLFGHFSLFQRIFIFKEKANTQDIIAWVLIFCCILLLSSKLMLIMALLLCLAWFLVSNSSKTLKWAALISVGFLAFLLSFLPVGQRFAFEFSETQKILALNQFDQGTYFTGTSVRVVLAKFNLQVQKECNCSLTGLGMGQLQDKLNLKIIESGMYRGDSKESTTGFVGYNTHNQYLHTLAESGIFGLIAFLGILGFMSWTSFKNGNYLILFMTIVFIALGLTENYIEVYFKGTLLFAFLYGLAAAQSAKSTV